MIYNTDCIIGSQKYLADEGTDLIVTDPPYNLGFGGTTQTKTKRPRFSIIANDNLSDQEYKKFGSSLYWMGKTPDHSLITLYPECRIS
ncbi:DNA modification methylase [Fontibacillus solani]|uniref:DNA modification methylase n=1 Tax=Fontibacillus solani TaxID=1572857 RepID=A0A7W3XSE8_9BACL|nr:site-specific DNA-methyltransferase [Fontibacillus solani]MBA9086479.1 DNA modification methylase [Fontibacillus solani]